MRARLVPTVRLVALIALESAAIPLLRGGGGAGAPASVDWGHFGRWLQVTPPEDAVTAAVRLVGLVLAAWLLATTVLYLLARVTRLGGLVRGIGWATLPVVRRVVDGALAASILGGSVLGAHPAGAQGPPPAPIVVELGTTTSTAPAHRYVPVPAGDVTAATSPVTSTTSAPAERPTSTLRGTTASLPAGAQPAAPNAGRASPRPEGPAHVHTVVAGDNLWTIAEADLARQSGRSVGDLTVGEIAAHWVKVVAANRDRVTSGNPNLIYPGETIVCPPTG